MGYRGVADKMVSGFLKAVDPTGTVAGIDDLTEKVSETTLYMGHHPFFYTEKDGNYLHSYDTVNEDGIVENFEYVVDDDTIDRMRHYYGIRLSKEKYGKWPTILAGEYHELARKRDFRNPTHEKYRRESTQADYKNNELAMNAIGGEEEMAIFSKMAYEEYEPTNEEMAKVVELALKNTVELPKMPESLK
jgi:hypothetical protein